MDHFGAVLMIQVLRYEKEWMSFAQFSSAQLLGVLFYTSCSTSQPRLFTTPFKEVLFFNQSIFYQSFSPPRAAELYSESTPVRLLGSTMREQKLICSHLNGFPAAVFQFSSITTRSMAPSGTIKLRMVGSQFAVIVLYRTGAVSCGFKMLSLCRFALSHFKGCSEKHLWENLGKKNSYFLITHCSLSK